MNDFLQNLRGGQKDNRAKTRRGVDNNQQYNSTSHFHSNNNNYQNSRLGNAKRPIRTNPSNPMVGESQPLTISSEIIENITLLADTIIKNQEFLAAVHERRAAAEERKADSLEEIAEYLRVIAIPALQDEERFQNGVYMGDEDIEGGDDEMVEGAFQQPEPQYTKKPEVADFQERVPEVSNFKERVADVVSSQERVPEVPLKKRRGRKPNALKLAEQNALNLEPTPETVKKIKVLKRTKAEKMEAVQEILVNKELLSRPEIMKIVDSMRKQGATFDQVAQHLVELGQPTFSGRGEWHAQTVHRLCNTKK